MGKISEEEMEELLQSRPNEDNPPARILPAPRLFDDLEVLESFFQAETPMHWPIRYFKVA